MYMNVNITDIAKKTTPILSCKWFLTILLLAVVDASPVPTPPTVKALVYKPTSKFLQQSDETDSLSASIAAGMQYADVRHPKKPIPNIMEPPVSYTQFKVFARYLLHYGWHQHCI